MKIFQNLQELIEQSKKDNACENGIDFLYSCKNLQEVFENSHNGHCLWALEKGYVQFEQYIDWKKLSVNNWTELLKFQPQYADKCDFFNEFDIYVKNYILIFQPQLEKILNF